MSHLPFDREPFSMEAESLDSGDRLGMGLSSLQKAFSTVENAEEALSSPRETSLYLRAFAAISAVRQLFAGESGLGLGLSRLRHAVYGIIVDAPLQSASPVQRPFRVREFSMPFPLRSQNHVFLIRFWRPDPETPWRASVRRIDGGDEIVLHDLAHLPDLLRDEIDPHMPNNQTPLPSLDQDPTL